MADIAGAQLRSFYGNVKVFKSDVCLCIVESRHPERLLQYSGDFARDAEDALAVRAVSRDGNIEKPVVKTKDRLYVRSDLCVIGKDEQSVVARAGIHIFADAKFNSRAEHAMGLKSAKLALLDGHSSFNCSVVTARGVYSRADQRCGKLLSCLDVIRAAADLESAVLTAVYGADVQMCVRNSLTGLNQAYDDP